MHIRRATPADARPLAELLGAIIARGGTTAMTQISRADMEAWIVSNPARSIMLIAENDAGELLGFQSIEPHPNLPEDACDIATFTRLSHAQLGIGSALFNKMEPSARALGYDWINAAIRPVNTGGIAYYQSRGFERYDSTPGQILMCYDLR